MGAYSALHKWFYGIFLMNKLVGIQATFMFGIADCILLYYDVFGTLILCDA